MRARNRHMTRRAPSSYRNSSCAYLKCTHDPREVRASSNLVIKMVLGIVAIKSRSTKGNRGGTFPERRVLLVGLQ